jgi:hypothetical protein
VNKDVEQTFSLNAEQVRFLLTSIEYSEQALREHDYGPVDRAWLVEHRRGQQEMIDSIRRTLSKPS